MFRERIIGLYQNVFSWFSMWYLLYGKVDTFTGVILFIGLISFPAFLICLTTAGKGIKFTEVERYNLFATLAMAVAFSGYMILCLFSHPTWLTLHNTKFAIFIAITTFFNLLTTYKLKE